jgi:hypothetical protein
MPDINEQCWNVIGALGSEDGSELPPAAVKRLMMMGLVTRDSNRKLSSLLMVNAPTSLWNPVMVKCRG